MIASTRPSSPTMKMTVPAVWMSNPVTWAVTAHFRIAPTAISRIAAPIVMSGVLPCAAAEYARTPGPDRRSQRADPLPPRLAQLALDLTARLTRADRFALVAHVLAACQRDLDLRARARPREVDASGHQRQPPLARAPRQPVDLAAVQEQLSRPLGVVVVS